jgi:molybdopterin-biosynthesis enzyme MoeA-like protein
MAGVARAFGRAVIRHPELEAGLRAFYGQRLSTESLERNLRMCDIPEGATLVHGEHPSWPVITVDNVYVLPGIPEIFRRKFASIRDRFAQEPFVLHELFSSEEEGRIAGHLDAVVAAFPAVQIGSYPRLDTPDYRVKVTLESKDAAAVAAAAERLAGLLGPALVRRTPA